MTFDLGREGHVNIFRVGMREGAFRKRNGQGKGTRAELCRFPCNGGGGEYACACGHQCVHRKQGVGAGWS